MFVAMDSKVLVISLLVSLGGFWLYFYLLELTIVDALKKFKKWEKEEEEKDSK